MGVTGTTKTKKMRPANAWSVNIEAKHPLTESEVVSLPLSDRPNPTINKIARKRITK
jgi:hypothetical protein